MNTSLSYVVISRRMEYILTVALLILGSMAPSLVHMVGGRGLILLPIFFALSLGAVTLSLPSLLVLALVVPTVNSYLFGMPAIPMLYVLVVEGLVISVAIVTARRTNLVFPIILFLAFLVARIIGGLSLFYFAGTPTWYQGIIQGIPGMFINITLGSLFYYVAKKSNHV